MSAVQKPYYPKPGAVGGRLIREVIGLLRAHGLELPLTSGITSDILIATSGGLDSMALAHLLVHYGRRVADRSRIRLLHINHGWRGAASDADARFVEKIGKKWGIRVVSRRLKRSRTGSMPFIPAGASWEEYARSERKRIYAEYQKKGCLILTAHHGDDLAETLLWRLFTGSHESHGGGIALQVGAELRPFLSVRKKMLRDYLIEEGVPWHEDVTNEQGRFLRSRMRLELMPVIERLFPRAVEHLIHAALQAQLFVKSSQESVEHLQQSLEPLQVVFSAAGLRVRRPHWDLIREKISGNASWIGEVHLPGGWVVTRTLLKKRTRTSDRNSKPVVSRTEQWTLTRPVLSPARCARNKVSE